jgi:DNA-binding PadR family transcriptional regulator
MKKEDLREGTWETSSGGGPVRRVYSITGAGEAYLDFWARSLENYQQKIYEFF